jgi:AAA+ superfamily predicted ATPase
VDDSKTASEKCSFCGKPAADVKKLIAGSDGAICDECVGLCVSVLEKESKKAAAAKPSESDRPPWDRVEAQLGRKGHELPLVEAEFAPFDRPNIQRALDALLAESGRSVEVIGLQPAQHHYRTSLADLFGGMQNRPARAPVSFVRVALAGGEALLCWQSALLLVTDPNGNVALLVGALDRSGMEYNVRVEVMAAERGIAERFVALLEKRMRESNVYRGNVVSLVQRGYRDIGVVFHAEPKVSREEVVLPEELLQKVERHTLRFSERATALKAVGRHLRRGLLLYGPPGTGKTLLVKHLLGRMEGRTSLILTGGGMGFLEPACRMARLLQPSTIVLEDVDLIAEARDRPDQSCNAILFSLLNQMDGIGEDADVLFLLTTNRPDILEPALASRPGRVDLAVEVPLPDEDGRARLLDLYGRGLTMSLEKRADLTAKLDGVSGAFIRELLRKAAVAAAVEGDGPLVVKDRHVNDALGDLMMKPGELTSSLLGVRKEH